MRQDDGTTGWKPERERVNMNKTSRSQKAFKPSKMAWEITSYNLELVSRQVVCVNFMALI